MRIIGLAPNSWQGQWVNRQQLLSRLGLQHTVVYSTGAWSIWDRSSAAWRTAALRGAFRRMDNVLVDEAPRLLLRWPKRCYYDRLILGIHARRLVAAAGHDGSPLLTLVFHPSFLPYVELLRGKFVAFHAYDLFEGTPGWTEKDDALERALLRRADLVTAVSPTIAARLEQKVPREVKVLPNGVDLAAFERARLALDDTRTKLADIPRPRLGYIGSLHPHVDLGLVASLARAQPSWQFVLVGPVIDTGDARAHEEMRQCRACPNVHFLGEVAKDDVPALAMAMDVHLLPYRLSDDTWIRGIYPLKLHEYLATGLPVVSADVPAVREFRHVVRIASHPSEWLAGLQEALSGGAPGSSSQRLAIAANNTWATRVAAFDAWINVLQHAPAARGSLAVSGMLGRSSQAVREGRR